MNIFDGIEYEIKRVKDLKRSFDYRDKQYLQATELELYLLNLSNELIDSYSVKLFDLMNEADTKKMLKDTFGKKDENK
ncbi:hypothetical protein ABE073_04925 [Lederbergia citrisecunda]|uniref:hypothetical protein n=1 Tax=Lederbergia citrisecunda TaxID=2833583 RepID=UPI003D28F1AB